MNPNQKRLQRLWFLVLLGLGFCCIQAAAKPIDFSELGRFVPEELKQTNTPGAVIAIVKGDSVVYRKAFGVANVETNAPMQPEMLFRLGSTTKMFLFRGLYSAKRTTR